MANVGHPFGRQLRTALEQGILFTAEQVRQEFAHFLSQVPPLTRSVVVEGYPRGQPQCRDFIEAVRDAGHRLATFVVLEIPDEVALQRVAGRRICDRCGLPASPSAELACSACGGQTVRRRDDEPQILARRLVEYRAFASEVQAYFESIGLLHVIDGRAGSHEVGAAVADVILAGPPSPYKPTVPG